MVEGGAFDGLVAEHGYSALVELRRGERSHTILYDAGLSPFGVRDNLRLSPDAYQILLRGAEIGQSRLPRGRALAIDPGDALANGARTALQFASMVGTREVSL